MLITSRPTSSGSSSRPDTVAETPCTSCRYCGRNARAPNIATPLTNAMMLETVKICIGTARAAGVRLRSHRLADHERDDPERAQTRTAR